MAPEVLNSLRIDGPHLRAVREGMRRVVMGADGTGYLARVEGVEYAGKTGTAQYGRRQSWRTWMVSYLPADKPRYAMVIFLEAQGESSGSAVGPRMRRLVEGLVRLEDERA